MAKTYAIGDLHGRSDLLRLALSLAESDCGDEEGTFVVCGDMIDRGPDSRGVIELLMSGPTMPNWKWVVLQGNHEDIMLKCLVGPHSLQWWLGNGGSTTLASYGYHHGDPLLPLKVPEDHLSWIAGLPLHYMDKHRAFVHAGFDPDRMIDEQSKEYMQWVRDPIGTDYSYAGRHVVHGHEQYHDGPILTPNKTNLDTFAWLHGRLAIGVWDDDVPGPPKKIMWAER